MQLTDLVIGFVEDALSERPGTLGHAYTDRQ
jgi:hypothetical protein